MSNDQGADVLRAGADILRAVEDLDAMCRRSFGAVREITLDPRSFASLNAYCGRLAPRGPWAETCHTMTLATPSGVITVREAL